MIDALMLLTVYHLWGIKKAFIVVGVLLALYAFGIIDDTKPEASREYKALSASIGFLIVMAIYYFGVK